MLVFDLLCLMCVNIYYHTITLRMRTGTCWLVDHGRQEFPSRGVDREMAGCLIGRGMRWVSQGHLLMMSSEEECWVGVCVGVGTTRCTP